MRVFAPWTGNIQHWLLGEWGGHHWLEEKCASEDLGACSEFWIRVRGWELGLVGERSGQGCEGLNERGAEQEPLFATASSAPSGFHSSGYGLEKDFRAEECLEMNSE